MAIKMKKFEVRFKSLSPVLFSRYTGKRPKDEDAAKWDEKTWKDRAHYENGKVIIPGYMIQKTLEPAAKLLGERVGGGKKGKGISHYIANVRILGNVKTKITKKTLKGHSAFVASTGKEGGPKVHRIYPQVDKWEGVLELMYPDLGFLNEDIIMRHLEVAGVCIGIGHWRPGSPSRGSYGLFEAKKIK